VSPRTARSPPSPTHKMMMSDSLNLGVNAMSISPNTAPGQAHVHHGAMSPTSIQLPPPISTNTQAGAQTSLGHTHIVLGGTAMALSPRTITTNTTNTSRAGSPSAMPMDMEENNGGPNSSGKSSNLGKRQGDMSLNLELPMNTPAAMNAQTVIAGRQNPIYHSIHVNQLTAGKHTSIVHASTCVVYVVDCSASNANTSNLSDALQSMQAFSNPLVPALSLNLHSQQKQSANGQPQRDTLPQLTISNCSNAAIYLLAPFACANIHNCCDCEIVIGSVAGALILSNCERLQRKRLQYIVI
jgi:hypothetical protein